MAGTELATAYVNLVPSTSAMGKEMSKYFSELGDKSEEQGKKSGNKYAQAFGRWAKRAVVAGAVAAGAVAGAALVSGFRSAVDQQQGQAVLSGLYGDASKAQQTLQDLKKVSKKSPLEYSGYQKAAESLAYAGVEGDSAIGVLENVGKAITAAGGGTQQLEQATGGVMKAVNNGGIAMMDSLGMISESGVPILSGLAEHFGVGIDEVKKMASEGKVNITDVMSVMEDATGDTFQKMLTAGDAASTTFGSQWKIAKDNVKVALGETLLPLIEKITPAIGPIGAAVEEGIGKLPEIFDRVSDGAKAVYDTLKPWAPLIGVIVGAMILWNATTKISTALFAIQAFVKAGWLSITGAQIGAMMLLTGAQKGLNAAMKANPIGVIVTVLALLVAGFIVAYKNVGWFKTAVDAAWAGIKVAALAVWNWIKNTLWPGMVAAWDAIAGAAVWLYENGIKPAWNGIKTAINAVWGWIRDVLWPGLQTAWEAIGNAAKWLYESIIKPVWNGIKLAIAIAVTAILVYIDLLKWWFEKVIAPVFKWLYNSVVKPVWNAIKTAIGAVVNWFKDTAWPLLSRVIDWLKAKFENFKRNLQLVWDFIKNRVINPVVAWFQNTVWPVIARVIDWLKAKFENFKRNLKIVWDAIKNRVINPVVAWFRDTAWPAIKRVIDKLKAGFQSMKDRLKAIWDGIKNNVVAPVANWFSDKLEPKLKRVTDNIKSAFDTMKDGIKKAWDGIKKAARVPAKFVVEDVYNDTIRATFNGVAKKLGLDTELPPGKVGFAKGGVMPGYTPGRDVHQFYSPTGGRLDLSGGEAIMRPEFTRAVGGPAGVAALNMKARKGQAFAGGGVWGKVKGWGGDAWDWAKDKASTIAEAMSDPLGILKKLASKAVGLIPGSGMVREITQQAGKNVGKWGGQWLKDQLFNSEVGGGTVPQAGSGSGGWGKASNAAAALGLRMTSGTRRGARTAGSGSVSMHALGRARDYAGSASAMSAFFDRMDSAPFPTELLYSPKGGRNIHRGGGRYANTGATKRNHYNHVHVAFKNGGVFDNGGMMEPGSAGVNLTRKPEAVLNPRATQAYQAHADSLSKNDGAVALSDEDRALLRAIAEAVDIKVDGRSVVRATTSAFKSARTPLVTA